MKRPMPKPEGKRPSAPVIIQRPHPEVWQHALGLAGGDHRRLRVEPDSSVIVHNNPV